MCWHQSQLLTQTCHPWMQALNATAGLHAAFQGFRHAFSTLQWMVTVRLSLRAQDSGAVAVRPAQAVVVKWPLDSRRSC